MFGLTKREKVKRICLTFANTGVSDDAFNTLPDETVTAILEAGASDKAATADPNFNILNWGQNTKPLAHIIRHPDPHASDLGENASALNVFENTPSKIL